MPLILAEDIGPWLLNAMVLFAGLGTALLALCGIAPAILAKRVITFCLITPAFLVGVGATWWQVQSYVQAGSHDEDHFIQNLLEPWILMAGVPLIASLVVGTVLFVRTRRRT